MSNPTAAMIVIGDEILSGRTRDSNAHHMAIELAKLGIELCEVRFVADVRDRIVEAVNALRESHDHVFTSGGIGPTHDDITADAVAAAFGARIDVRADARAILEARYAKMGIEVNAARLRMARIPDGARLIDNDVSGAPGFSLGNVHVMAGVPSVFVAMVAWLLPRLTGGRPVRSAVFRIDLPEGEIASPLAEVAAAWPGVSIGSYPFIRDGRFGAQIVLRSSDAAALDGASAEIRLAFPAAVSE